jgi:hypothetical protein
VDIAQLAGEPGREGIYAVDIPLQDVAPTTITASFGILSVTAVEAPVLCPGVELEGPGIPLLSAITAAHRRGPAACRASAPRSDSSKVGT